MNQVRLKIRALHYGRRTEKTGVYRGRHFILHAGKRDPVQIAAAV